jgi:hypothetical protein
MRYHALRERAFIVDLPADIASAREREHTGLCVWLEHKKR